MILRARTIAALSATAVLAIAPAAHSLSGSPSATAKVDAGGHHAKAMVKAGGIDLPALPGAEVPSVPEDGVPGVPSTPDLPVPVPGLPSVPGVPSLPGVPPLPGLPPLPGVPSLPVPLPGLGVPSLPSLPGVPALPEAGVPALPGVPSLADLPLPAVPGLDVVDQVVSTVTGLVSSVLPAAAPSVEASQGGAGVSVGSTEADAG